MHLINFLSRYTGDGEVGMSVMEIGILTGFIPIKESFEEVWKKYIVLSNNQYANENFAKMLFRELLLDRYRITQEQFQYQGVEI